MRLRAKGRATRDIDLVVDGAEAANAVAALRDALEDTYQGFAFRVKGDPHVMRNDAVRVEVAIEYRGRGWGTIQVDLSPGEAGETEVELVEPLDLAPFGLETPAPLPCLSLRYQIAQKIHAMTEPALDDGTSNERFRDLVDLLFMKELAGDLVDIRTVGRTPSSACPSPRGTVGAGASLRVPRAPCATQLSGAHPQPACRETAPSGDHEAPSCEARTTLESRAG